MRVRETRGDPSRGPTSEGATKWHASLGSCAREGEEAAAPLSSGCGARARPTTKSLHHRLPSSAALRTLASPTYARDTGPRLSRTIAGHAWGRVPRMDTRAPPARRRARRPRCRRRPPCCTPSSADQSVGWPAAAGRMRKSPIPARLARNKASAAYNALAPMLDKHDDKGLSPVSRLRTHQDTHSMAGPRSDRASVDEALARMDRKAGRSCE